LRYAALILCTIALLVLAGAARSHVLPHKKHMSLSERRDLQLRTLRHDRVVERFFRRHGRLARTLAGRESRAWHRAQRRWTRRELRETLSALERLLVPHRPQWLCIHSYEGDWEDGGDPHWGGLQMDWSFLHTYGADFIRRHGEPRGVSGPDGWANAWTPTEQMIAAERAHRSGRGFYPWPNTARYCGLL
jgi:hypothetical protein